jgi:hypothetical protein
LIDKTVIIKEKIRYVENFVLSAIAPDTIVAVVVAAIQFEKTNCAYLYAIKTWVSYKDQ